MRIKEAPLRLGHRIVGSVALGLGSILALFGIVVLWTVQDSVDAAYRERVTLAETLSSQVNDVLRYALFALEREASDLRVTDQRTLSPEDRERLGHLRLQTGIFSILTVTDATGNVLWTEPADAGPIMEQARRHPSLLQVLGSGRPQVSEFRPEAGGGKGFACLAVPLHGANGALDGILMAEIDPSHPAFTLLPSAAEGNTIRAQLVDAAGSLLAGANEFGPQAIQEHMALADNFLGQMSGFRIHSPSAGQAFPSHIVAYARVPSLPSWGVFMEQPQDVVLTTPRQLLNRLVLLGLGALLVAASVAWLDVRRVVRPLTRLTTAAERFAAGQLDEPVEFRGAYEIRVLAHAFDTMRQRLAASLEEFADWNRSALVDPDRVIALVLLKARSVGGADLAGLTLVEEGAPDMAWHLLSAAGGRPRKVRAGNDEGIAGYVIQTGQPLVVEDWSNRGPGDPSGVPIVEAESLRAVLAVPLQTGGQRFGVLMVGNSHVTQFSDDQVALLVRLANQAAVALDNARLYRKVQSLAVMEERERIAREMHDGLAQVLGYVNTKTLAVRRLVEIGRIAEAATQLDELEAAAREVYLDVREAILGLRTTLKPQRGFLATLRDYLAEFQQQSGMAISFDAPRGDTDLGIPVASEIQLVRIVQEALTNVRRHARATAASVSLATGADGFVHLVVEDDGVGFDPCRSWDDGRPHFGLQTMRERAQGLGGTFEVYSQPGSGTRVVVKVPRERLEVRDDTAASIAG